jgi:hypothetical protein
MRFDQLERREFITLLGGAAAGWPARSKRAAAADPFDGLPQQTRPLKCSWTVCVHSTRASRRPALLKERTSQSCTAGLRIGLREELVSKTYRPNPDTPVLLQRRLWGTRHADERGRSYRAHPRLYLSRRKPIRWYVRSAEIVLHRSTTISDTSTRARAHGRARSASAGVRDRAAGALPLPWRSCRRGPQ